MAQCAKCSSASVNSSKSTVKMQQCHSNKSKTDAKTCTDDETSNRTRLNSDEFVNVVLN